jgi:curved DNA-binding protein CbpA
VARRDVTGLSLSSTDGFVLSRVDGTSNEHDLAATMGLPADQVRASLAKLESLGLITFGEGPPAPTASGTMSASPVPAARPGTHVASEPLSAEDEAALAEDVEIEPDLRRQILGTLRALDRLDYYALLQIDRNADRKSIKRAYYDLAARFHPDRYFRKKIGSFKDRFEAIFHRLTLAHDTLSNREKKAEYDTYLEDQRKSRGLEELLADALEEVRRVEESVQRTARAQEPAPAEAVTSVAPAPEPPVVAPAPGPPTPDVHVAARRDALARRLLGGRAHGAGRVGPGAAPGSARRPAAGGTPADAMASLRQRYEDRVARARALEAQRYADHGAALAANDPVAAANAFRVALGLMPGDADLQRRAQEAQTKADAILSETYIRQARYEE